MRFCPKCGSLMKVKGNKMVCSRCKYSDHDVEKVILKENISHENDKTIIADGETLEGRVAISLCPRCGSVRAILLNKRKRLYRCMACNFVYNI
ncbi:DNA-directed RNA polymerase subunit M [Sulfolobus sp. E5-1-F]|uniref:transcription factor S4 n=2 Tax=Sulfolobaceae TaxID=118883 RepID=UPI001295F054|nr:RPA12/RPB9/RPC11 RNA polymerase family protein [Sulfolobus sp. E5-1-F]QGA54134.1 DNA-directed RNA polymerase subunit M [Sulfolobus sp. E5-1-F]QGA69191.1 DNA-directed RNA polymerase subunit M [Sulfolobus sp. E11-6]